MDDESINPKNFDVVVVGEINVDIILKGDVVPAFDQVEQIVEGAEIAIGSSAVIFACGAVRLGLKTAFIGKVGNDLFGNFMVESMENRGIDISGIIVDPQIKTGFSVILTNKNDRAILTFPGSIPELKICDINYSLISQSRHLHLSSYYLLDKLRPDIPALFNKVKDMDLTISLDTNYDPTGKWNGRLGDILQNVDVFLPNETEAKAISGEGTVDKALYKLAEIGPTVAIKCGKSGAIAIWKNMPQIKQKAPPVNIEDTVGAGDSFDAGFIYGFLSGWLPEKTLQLAVSCGSLSTTKSGGTAGQTSLLEALEYMERGGEKPTI